MSIRDGTIPIVEAKVGQKKTKKKSCTGIEWISKK